jgi:YbbR domain-containing protein
MRWLLRNWHLKLAAAGLALILYTGFVYSGSFSETTFNGAPIRTLGLPDGGYLLTQQLGSVDIRYRLAADATRVTADSFAVTVDLGSYDMDHPAQPQALSVTVDSLQDGLEILDFSPKTVPVQIDRLGTKRVRVMIDTGVVPEGLQIGTPVVDVRDVEAAGPESQLSRLDHAVARVVVQQSGIDVEAQVPLVPVDIDGQTLDSVDLTPQNVSVSIDVQTVETSKTVPITLVVTGSPASGYEVGAVSIVPSIVTLRGTPDVLAGITEVRTQAVSVTNATETVTAAPEIVVPEGVRLADGQDATPSVSVQVRATIVTRTFLVGVVCQGAPSGSACLPQLTQVALTVRGEFAVIDGLDPALVTPILDVSGLGPGSHDVSVGVVLPSGVEFVSISPGIVTVVIELPATPTPAPG